MNDWFWYIIYNMNLNSTNCNWRLGDYTYVKRTYKKKPEKKKKQWKIDIQDDHLGLVESCREN